MKKQKRAAPWKKQPRECGPIPLNFKANVQMYILLCNTDTGQLLAVEVTTPIEYVPFGFYALSYTGTKQQIEKLIRKLQRYPSLLEKYTEL